MKKGIVIILAVFLAVALAAGEEHRDPYFVIGEFTLYDVRVDIDGTEVTFWEIPMQASAQVERKDSEIIEVVYLSDVESKTKTVIPDDDSLGEFYVSVTRSYPLEKAKYRSDGSATLKIKFLLRLTPKVDGLTPKVDGTRADTEFYYPDAFTAEVTFRLPE
ncbi:MAG: hypothetical protein FWE86_04350 [Oscillospiraceae bacterium]|nr:hypothetical protein [Oscillospiraceae bacterium]